MKRLRRRLPGSGCFGCSRSGVRAPRRDESGSAIIEFIFLGVLLLVPVIYVVLVAGRLQAASFAVDAAARSGARAFTITTEENSVPAAQTAVELALRDQGFQQSAGQAMRWSCSTQPCLQPEGRVTIDVQISVGLPGVPDAVQSVVPLRVNVSSSQVAVVDAYRHNAGARS